MRRRAYLIQDPYDTDAIEFIRAIFIDFGLRPVCFYTDPKGRYYGEQAFPILTSDAIEASFDADLDDLGDLARRVTETYDIVGIVPYREDTLEVAANILRHLDVDWNSAETLALCRDKNAMKQHLATAEPAVRVPRSAAIRTYDDIVACDPPKRFVLKPNSGMGSTHLGFFSATDDRDTVERHLALDPDGLWALEEFIDGIEYRVNGMIRRDGTVQTLLVMEYHPVQLDEHFALAYASESQVHSTDDRFGPLHEYAAAAIGALGVRGVPFHMEVKVDDEGPALIDFGARVGSEGTGYLLSQLHPGRPNLYSVAGHDHVGPNTFAMDPVDYEHYDSMTSVLVYGISEIGGVISSMDGFDEIEAMPEFVNWPVRPSIGDPIRVMRELRDSPYIVALRHDGPPERSQDLIEHVRATIRFNERSERQRKARATAKQTLTRARRKSRWIAHRMKSASDLRTG